MSFKDINETVSQIKMLYFTKNDFSFSIFILLAAVARFMSLAFSRLKSNDTLRKYIFLRTFSLLSMMC